MQLSTAYTSQDMHHGILRKLWPMRNRDTYQGTGRSVIRSSIRKAIREVRSWQTIINDLYQNHN